MKKIIYLIMLLMSITIVNAATWEQYLPSPLTDDLREVFVFDNGMAIAHNGESAVRIGGSFGTTPTKTIRYNGSVWSEVSSISTIFSNATLYRFRNDDKVKNSLLYLFTNNTASIPGMVGVYVVKYDVETDTYSQIYNSSDSGELYYNDSLRIGCVYNDETCYVGIRNLSNSSKGLQKVYPTNSLFYSHVSSSKILAPISSDDELMTTAGYNAGVYEWNGFSFVDKQIIMGEVLRHFYNSATERAILISPIGQDNLTYYNYSTGIFNSYSPLHLAWVDEERMIMKVENYLFYFGSVARTSINKTEFGSYDSENEINFEHPMIAMDYNDISNVGTAVGEGGIIYMYNNTGAGFSYDDFSVSLSISPNPTIIGKNVTFCVTPYSPDGYESNINISIDSVGYLIELLGVPSGYRYCYNIDSLTWTNFQIGNYSVVATGNDLSSTSDTDTIIWRIVDISVENTTYYNSSIVASYNITDQALSVDTKGNYLTYFVSGYNNNLYLSNLLIGDSVTNYTISNLNIDKATAGVNTLRTMGLYLDYVFIGTNNEMYIYHNITYGSSNAVKQDDVDITGIFNDDIIDLAVVSNESVYACNYGLSGLSYTYKIWYYNGTSGGFDWNFDDAYEGNCRSIYYDRNNDYLLVHNINKVYVFNRTLIENNAGTSSSLKNYSCLSQVQNSHDLLDSSDNYLFYVYDYNKINRSLTSSFGSSGQCRTANGYIRSIEAMNDEEVIIGVCSADNSFCRLEVCDFGNSNSLYNNYYTSNSLDYLPDGFIPFEIKKNSATRYSIAARKGVLVYDYRSFDDYSEVNQAPVINSVTFSDTSPCINQIVNFFVNATDYDGDLLTYGRDCDATDGIDSWSQLSNKLTCYWSVPRSYDVNIWVDDGMHSNPTYETYNFVVSNCTADYTINIHLVSCVNGNPSGADIVSGVCTINGVNTTTTNSYGRASFVVGGTGFYTISCNADNHFSNSWSLKEGTESNICLSSTNLGDNTALIVITQNGSGAVVPNTLVSVTNSETGENRYGLTDSNGQLVFTEMFYGNKLIIAAQNEQYGYDATGQWYLSLAKGEQKTFYINLSEAWVTGRYVVTERNCTEMIKGVWLCGFLNTSGTGDYCTNDSQCISARCFMNQCSKFNYTICDDKNIGRGNACLFYETINGSLAGIGKWFLKEFFYLIIIIIIVAIIVILRKNKD